MNIVVTFGKLDQNYGDSAINWWQHAASLICLRLIGKVLHLSPGHRTHIVVYGEMERETFAKVKITSTISSDAMNGLRSVLRVVFYLAAISTSLGSFGKLAAQPENRSIHAASNAPSGQAFTMRGQPFGVAFIDLPVGVVDVLQPQRDIEVKNSQGRLFYPVSRNLPLPPGATTRAAMASSDPLQRPINRRGNPRLMARVADALQNVLNPPEQRIDRRQAFFLFQGDAPLAVEVSGPTATNLTLNPEPQPQQFGLVIQQWWEAYTAMATDRIKAADYPPLVEPYLVTSLARRFQLPLPENFTATVSTPKNPLQSVLELIAGTEKMRAAAFLEVSTQQPLGSETTLAPIPAGPTWTPAEQVETSDDVRVELTASRVPPECFYLRFGSFANYLWFNDLMSQYGGDISGMFRVRQVQDAGTSAIETQLSMKLTEMSRMLGATVIEDQAIIGSDLFLSEGASLGILIKAKSRFLLETAMRAERASKAGRDDVTLVEEEMEGRTVSLLSSPDHRVRSFMIVDGDWIFVTNSRRLMKRFVEVGVRGPSMAESADFQYARQLVPLDRGDTVFAYFPSAMLRTLLEPHYQIELRRRLQVVGGFSMYHLAQIAAQSEGFPPQSIGQLQTEGFLPEGFGQQADGSTLEVKDGVCANSIRGIRGRFLPIPDVPLAEVTAAESRWYQEQADYFTQQWQQVDPIIFAVRRQETPEGWERLQVHCQIAPLVPEKYGWIAHQLGPPTTQAIQFAPDDIVSAHAHVVSDRLSGTIPPHYLFAAIKDTVPPRPEDMTGLIRGYFALQSTPGYLGAWPQPGVLDRLPFGIGRGTPVAPGTNRLLGGLYRYQGNGFSVLSFQYDVLTASLASLRVIETKRDAQVRLKVGNLQNSKLASWVNNLAYQQAAETSRAGAMLLDQIARQLNVEPDSMDTTSQQILGTILSCPLQGDYVYASDGRRPGWRSSAWDDRPAPPDAAAPGFESPILQWFRGLSAEITQYPDRLVIDATIDTQYPHRFDRSDQTGPDRGQIGSDATSSDGKPAGKVPRREAF